MTRRLAIGPGLGVLLGLIGGLAVAAIYYPGAGNNTVLLLMLGGGLGGFILGVASDFFGI